MAFNATIKNMFSMFCDFVTTIAMMGMVVTLSKLFCFENILVGIQKLKITNTLVDRIKVKLIFDHRNTWYYVES